MATLNLGRIKPVFQGAYNNSTAYIVDDIVTFGDETFICIQASTGNATSNASYWTKLAAKGTNGTNGTDVGTVITTQGDILYRDGSGLQRLAKPASDMYLKNTSAGAVSWSALSSDYVKLATVSASSSSSIAIDGHFTSDYQRYEIHASDVIPSANCDMYYRVYSGGSEVGSNVYNNTSIYWYTDITPTSQTAGNNAGSQDMDAPSDYFKMGGDDHIAGQPCMFKIVIHDPLNTNRRKQVELMTAYSGNGGSGGQLMQKMGNGVVKSNSALSGFAFYPTSGNFTSGTFKLYGIK